MRKSDRERNGLTRRWFVSSAGILTVPGEAAARVVTGPVSGDNLIKTELNVNGRVHSLNVEPRWTLQYVLRDQLGLTGTKAACERGECGACTVLIDGVARYSCMTLAVEAAGAQITTVEGLLRGEEPGPVQQAFIQEDAFQCGFCTPGQVVNAEGLLRKHPEPNMDQIREGVSGNICRCGAYANIFRAVQRAAELRKS